MFVIATRNFPPEVGGMQNLMGGLSNALINHGPVKVFADKVDNFEKLYHNDVVFLTMVINAHVINGSDPGAVPGGSTKKF